MVTQVMSATVRDFPSEPPSGWLLTLRRIARAQQIAWNRMPITERQAVLAEVDRETEALKRIKAGGM
jgi:hypothetical protein